MKRSTKGDWGALIREQLRSGKSQIEFCRERGISVATLQYHKGRGAHLEGEDKAEFLPLVRELGESRIELQVGRDVKVFLPSSISAERFKELVECLSSN